MARGDREPEVLQLGQDLTFERRSQTVRRIAWGIGGVLIVLAVLGVFGTGVLADASTDTGNGRMALEYQRFTRFGTSTDLVVTVAPRGSSKVRLTIPNDYLQSFQVQQVTPDPSSVVAGHKNTLYEFDTRPVGTQVISFAIQADKSGFQTGEISAPGGPTLSFHQLVYP